MDRNTFVKMLERVSVNINETQWMQFEQYYGLLTEWNKSMNLTKITDYEEVQIKHFADSLAVKRAIDELSLKDKKLRETLNCSQDISEAPFDGISIMDVGTGAGFPGIPLKIAFPHTKVTLLDSLNKRVNFLNETIQRLSLTDIQAIHARAEDLARDNCFREKYTLGVSRAVANLATLSEYVLPFIKPGGYFIAYKSGAIDKELSDAKKAIQTLGGKIAYVYPFTLPDTDIERSFVFLKKESNTPKKYPRKSGLPGKLPIQ